MTFRESVVSVYFTNYSNFNGRSSRSELWWATLFMFLISILGGVLIGVFIGMDSIGLSEEEISSRIVTASDYFGLIFMLINVTPLYALNARRFHDVGKSTKESVIIYSISFISSLIAMKTFPFNLIAPSNEILISTIVFLCVISNIYLLYIYLKKSI